MNKQSFSALFANLVLNLRNYKKSAKENYRKITAESKKKLKLHNSEYIKYKILSNKYSIIFLKKLSIKSLEGLVIFKFVSDYCIRKMLRNVMYF